MVPSADRFCTRRLCRDGGQPRPDRPGAGEGPVATANARKRRRLRVHREGADCAKLKNTGEQDGLLTHDGEADTCAEGSFRARATNYGVEEGVQARHDGGLRVLSASQDRVWRAARGRRGEAVWVSVQVSESLPLSCSRPGSFYTRASTYR